MVRAARKLTESESSIGLQQAWLHPEDKASACVAYRGIDGKGRWWLILLDDGKLYELDVTDLVMANGPGCPKGGDHDAYSVGDEAGADWECDRCGMRVERKPVRAVRR